MNGKKFCCGCGKWFDEKDIEIFIIDSIRCRVYYKVIGTARVAVCKSCLEKFGKPVQEYYGTIKWENGSETNIWELGRSMPDED